VGRKGVRYLGGGSYCRLTARNGLPSTAACRLPPGGAMDTTTAEQLSPGAARTPLGGMRVRQESSLWLDAWVRLRRNKLAVLGLVFLVLIALVALLAPLLAPE